MDLVKQKAFNSRMGKAKHYPRHQNLAKGGMVDRKHLAFGGGLGFNSQLDNGPFTSAAPTAAATTPVVNNNPVGQNLTQGGLFGSLSQQSEYNAQLAPTTQLDYSPTVTAASTGALNSQPVADAMAAERGLASQYTDIAAGRGPNPALDALHQQTGTNVANTAALQAGQRGGAANTGLLARQIGQQGAATQQNAAGQAATLQANQQLGAIGAQAGLQNQIASQGLGEQGVHANLYGTAAGANTGQNNTNVANYAMAQGVNAATANTNTEAAAKTEGGLLGGIGSALGAIFHEGGEVHKMDRGGLLNIAPLPTVEIQAPQPSLGVSLPGAPVPVAANEPILGVANLPGASISDPSEPAIGGKSVGSYLSDILGGGKGGKDDPTGFKGLGAGLGAVGSKIKGSFAEGGKVATGPHNSHVANYLFAEGGMTDKVPALVSAKEVYLNPHQVTEVVERGADPMKIGHHFPGKDKVSKNSQKNDVIPVDLDDGGVVLPISITTHKHASEKGRKFVERAHAKRHMKKPKGI